MQINKIIDQATDFGTPRSRKHVLSFILKIILYIIPAVILGNYTDIFVQQLESHNIFGENILYYILVQTIITILTLYVFITIFTDYGSEFKDSMAGTYFIVLYFGMQTNYIFMLKEYLNF